MDVSKDYAGWQKRTLKYTGQPICFMEAVDWIVYWLTRKLKEGQEAFSG